MKQQSELQRAAEQEIANARRLIAWKNRFLFTQGRMPKTRRDLIAKQERHGNGNIVKFPSRKRQIMGARLPTGPEAA